MQIFTDEFLCRLVFGAGDSVARGQIPALAALEPQRGQPPAHERAGVDPDAVRHFLDFGRNRVAVDHDVTVVAIMGDEALAYPAQVPGLLLGERHSWANPGVDEQVVADDDRVLGGAHEFDVLGRHRLAHPLLKLFERQLAIARAIDRIAEHGFAPAIAQEMAKDVDIVEAVEEHFLVIARQHTDRSAPAPVARRLDNTRAVGSAVDEVAEQDHRGLGRTAAEVVGLDRRDHVLEQIEPAVDVADRIDPLAFGHRGAAGGRGVDGDEHLAEAAYHGRASSVSFSGYGPALNLSGAVQCGARPEVPRDEHGGPGAAQMSRYRLAATHRRKFSLVQCSIKRQVCACIHKDRPAIRGGRSLRRWDDASTFRRILTCARPSRPSRPQCSWPRRWELLPPSPRMKPIRPATSLSRAMSRGSPTTASAAIR